MPTTFELVLSLTLAAIDFQNKELEAKVEAVISASAVSMNASQMVDSVKGDADPSDQIAGLVDLGQTFGSASLSPGQISSLKESVRKIVRWPENPALEAALEGLFFGILDLTAAAKGLNAFVSELGEVDGGEG